MAIEGFQDWLRTPQGAYILSWEQALMDRLVTDIFGFNAVQLGMPQVDFLAANRMPLRALCLTSGEALSDRAALRADLHHLPFASASVDLVVLPHVLEFDEHPHRILREVERVLVPEGSVIVVGFNPFSLWGLRRRFTAQPASAPWRGRYISVPRLKDWFALLGLEPRAGAFGCYQPALNQRKWFARLKFLDLAGDRWWPIGGAVYIIQAVKKVHGMRLIQPKWLDRLARARALVAAAQKVKER